MIKSLNILFDFTKEIVAVFGMRVIDLDSVHISERTAPQWVIMENFQEIVGNTLIRREMQ